MKIFTYGLVSLLIMPYTAVEAAVRNYSVKSRIPVIEERGRIYQSRHDTYGFRVEIISDTEGAKSESRKHGRPFVTAVPGERYAVRLHNPLPVRVAVNLTVDGLNSISGKPGGIADGEKWLIEPYGFITIRGWQVSGGEARRFFFTDKPKSYAKWQGDRLDKDLSVNCGVIGAAFFWSRNELARYWEEHPIYRSSRPVYRDGPSASLQPHALGLSDERRRDAAHFDKSRKEAPAAEQEAGTGMGERESHWTTQVEFHYDTGMYKPSQAVVIYYDFAQATPVPNPFPELSYAPEMP